MAWLEGGAGALACAGRSRVLPVGRHGGGGFAGAPGFRRRRTDRLALTYGTRRVDRLAGQAAVESAGRIEAPWSPACAATIGRAVAAPLAAAARFDLEVRRRAVEAVAAVLLVLLLVLLALLQLAFARIDHGLVVEGHVLRLARQASWSTAAGSAPLST